MDTKKWYASKTIWVGIVGILIVAYNASIPIFHLPAIPEFVFAILAALGIYSRTTTTTKIG